MKTILISALTVFFSAVLSLNAHGQQADILKMWDGVWNAYEKNDPSMWNYYAEDACEVYPDGSHICGMANIKAGYEQFAGMLEGTPTWTYTQPEVRMIEPTVALLVAEITSDIKLKGGQQIGGKTKFTALVRKQNNSWKIVYDSQTPVLQMPGN